VNDSVDAIGNDTWPRQLSSGSRMWPANTVDSVQMSCVCVHICDVFMYVCKTSARPVETIQHYQRAAELLLQVCLCVLYECLCWYISNKCGE